MNQFKISVVLAMATSFAFYATSAFALDKVHLQTDWIPSGEHAHARWATYCVVDIKIVEACSLRG